MKVFKYMSIIYLIVFFVLITVVGLRDCDKPKEPEQFVLVDDIIFEVFAEELYE